MNDTLDKQQQQQQQQQQQEQPEQDYPKSYHVLFERIAAFYVESRYRTSLAPISASDCDDQTPRPMYPHLLTHWITDLEHAIEDGCRGDPRKELAVLEILREYAGFGPANVSHQLRHAVIQDCGKVIERRGLNPAKYFRHTHHRQHREGER